MGEVSRLPVALSERAGLATGASVDMWDGRAAPFLSLGWSDLFPRVRLQAPGAGV